MWCETELQCFWQSVEREAGAVRTGKLFGDLQYPAIRGFMMANVYAVERCSL